MADDTSKRGADDRSQVAGGEPYEVDYFAKKHGMNREDAQALIDRVGNSRAKLDAAVAAQATTSTRAVTSRVSSARRTRAAPRAKPAKPKRTASAESTTVDAITIPIAKAVTPAKRRVARAATQAKAAIRRTSSTARKTAEKIPARVGKRAGAVAQGTKSTLVGSTAKLMGAAAVGLVAGLAANLGRKAVVQSPSALAGDWFEAVKVEHKLALALFDQLQATDDSEPAKRTTLLTQLKHALGKHAFTEENVLYPALRDWGDKADADKLNHDHGYVKQSLFELEQLDKATSSFLIKIAEFRADLEAHIREEEEAIFPKLHAALSEKRNGELTRMANKEGFKLA